MIYEVLGYGKESAISGKTLCRLYNLKSIRDLTAIIERERREGNPICASTGRNPGYYIPENTEEMEEYCGQLRHRAREIIKTMNACKKSMKGRNIRP